VLAFIPVSETSTLSFVHGNKLVNACAKSVGFNLLLVQGSRRPQMRDVIKLQSHASFLNNHHTWGWCGNLNKCFYV